MEQTELTPDEIDFNKLFSDEQCLIYLKTSVRMTKAQKVLFELGSDDGVKLWLNGKLIHENNVFRGHEKDQDSVEATMKEGCNSLVMKVTQGTRGWAALLAITDKNSKIIPNLQCK